MKGFLGNPFYLQSTILGMGGFYLLSLCTMYASDAYTNCHYLNNDHPETYKDQYEILCPGNAMTSLVFGITAVITLLGAFAGLINRDIDIVLSVVLFGVICGYTSDTITQLRLNCNADSMVKANKFNDDSFDPAEELCQTYTYGTVGGIYGMIGAAASAIAGVLMKLKGKFYAARPIGLFVAMSGYALIFCFIQLGASTNTCHYLDGAKEYLKTVPAIAYDTVNHQINYVLEPQCESFQDAAKILGSNAIVPILGIAFIIKFKKKGMWFTFCLFSVLLCVGNTITFNGQRLSLCDLADTYQVSQYLGQTPYQYTQYRVQCGTFTMAFALGLIGIGFSMIGLIVSVLDILIDLDHDSFIVRLRRACMFAFGGCFQSDQMLIAIGKMTPDCDLFHGNLDDFMQHDDSVLENNCIGRSSAVFFNALAIAIQIIGIIISLRFNFPMEGAPVQKEDLKSEEKTDYFGDNRHPSVGRARSTSDHDHRVHALSRDIPVASTLFRFQSYYYKEDEIEEGKDSLMDTSSKPMLQQALLK